MCHMVAHPLVVYGLSFNRFVVRIAVVAVVVVAITAIVAILSVRTVLTLLVLSISAILAVSSITVGIAVLALRHIDTVYHNGHVW